MMLGLSNPKQSFGQMRSLTGTMSGTARWLVLARTMSSKCGHSTNGNKWSGG